MSPFIENHFLDEAMLKNALRQFELHLFKSIDSTNQYLLNHAANLPNGAICLAEQQTAGRGRRGRVWHSPKAGNIYLSQFFYSKQMSENLSGLSLVIGLSIAKTLTEFGVPDIKLKWPNDVYWQDKKLGGILIETLPLNEKKFGIVVGVGINVAMQESAETESINQAWISLSQIIKQKLNKTELIISLVNRIAANTHHCIAQGIKPFLAEWQRFDNFFDQEIKILTANQEIVGTARGIDEKGALLVEVSGELIRFYAGEVSLRKR